MACRLNQCWIVKWTLHKIFIFSFKKMRSKRRQEIGGHFNAALMC